LPLAGPIIRPFRDDDGLGSLSLGADFQPLKSFLKRHARQYEREWVARTYVVVDRADLNRGGRVWGYVTLVASEVQLGAAHAPVVDHWPVGYSHPAVKLARMALDRELRGCGLGREMLSWVMALVQEKVATRIGCRVLVTDAKRSAVGFYESVGFTLLDTEANRNSDHPVMFLPLNKGQAQGRRN
jgi:ribosomal protein S18 acetylase RimI-like enzyme